MPPSLETRLGSVAVVSQTARSSRYPDARSKSPARRKIHLRRRLATVNQIDAPGHSHAGAPKPSEGRHIDQDSLMWTSPRPSPYHLNKQDLMKLNLKTVSFAPDARRMFEDVILSVNRLCSITLFECLRIEEINFRSTRALRLPDVEGCPPTKRWVQSMQGRCKT